jgi:hypothetical protein
MLSSLSPRHCSGKQQVCHLRRRSSSRTEIAMGFGGLEEAQARHVEFPDRQDGADTTIGLRRHSFQVARDCGGFSAGLLTECWALSGPPYIDTGRHDSGTGFVEQSQFLAHRDRNPNVEAQPGPAKWASDADDGQFMPIHAQGLPDRPGSEWKRRRHSCG